MANRSGRTRKEQVLDRLSEHLGEWVNGSDLATAECGGSEGLKRLREARSEGWPIEDRRHPDGERDVWQYRLTGPGPSAPGVVRKIPQCPSCGADVSRSGTPALGGYLTGKCWSCRKPFTIRIGTR